MGRYFLTTKETLISIYEVKADSVESAIDIYKNGKGDYCLYESETQSDEIVSVVEGEDEYTPMYCDHCGTKLTEGTTNYVRTKNGKKFYICNKCLDKSFTNEEWDSLVELLSRI